MEQQTERELTFLIALFGRAEAEISKRLLEATQNEAFATARKRKQKQQQIRAVLATLLKDTVGDPGKLERESKDDSPAWRLIRLAYREGTDAALRNMERNGIPQLATGFSQTHQDAAEVAYENLRDRLVDAVGYVGRKADDVFRKIGLEEVTQKLLTGRTSRDTAKTITDRLRDRGVKAFRDKRGREMDLLKYAEMVARTTTREAVTHGTLNRIAENGVDLIRVSKHAGSCKICKPFEGKIYSIREGHPVYPAMTDVPPFHPNCAHVIYPYVDDLFSEAVEENGSVRDAEDEIKNYDVEHGRVFTPDGTFLFSKIGEESSISFNPDELARMRGNVFTHNHPAGLSYPEGDPRRVGNSFSLADIRVASRHGLAEIRAVTPVYRYSMKPPPGGWDADFAEEVLTPSYARHNDDVYAESWEAIQDGTMTTAEASARHYHEVWKRVSEETGLQYSQEEL